MALKNWSIYFVIEIHDSSEKRKNTSFISSNSFDSNKDCQEFVISHIIGSPSQHALSLKTAETHVHKK